MNSFGLYFDGDLRRVYEVPADSSFTVDADGYRIYVPDDIATAATSASITTTYLWSRWVEFHGSDKWSTLALAKSGGAFRFKDSTGADSYANFDLRWTNQWQFVLADYPHQFLIDGNLYPDDTLGTTFDSSRTAAQGVIPTINFADAVQVVSTGVSGLTDSEAAVLMATLRTQERMLKAYGMAPGSSFKMPPASGGPVLEDGEPIADVSGDCATGFTVTGRPVE